MGYAIEVANISKTYKLYSNPKDRLKEALSLSNKKLHKDFFALKDIDFKLKKGDTLGIIGKNGSGKSTLLKIIAKIIQPTSGKVKLNGKVSALIELGAGFNPEFTGLENIKFYGSILGFSKEEIEAKLDDIITFADIGEFLYQPLKTYSSGMKSRLAFSVAINTNPEILIVDEVLSVGDMFFKQKCINKLRQMLDDGLTLFFVSHSLNDIKALCNKALYIDKGKQVMFSNAESVCNVYQNQENDRIQTQINSNTAIKNTNTKLQIKPDINNYFNINNNFSTQIVNRSGGYELTVTAVDLYDENNNKNNTFLSNSIFKVVISIIANANIYTNSSLGILIRDGIGNDIVALNSNAYGIFLPTMKKGKMYVFVYSIQIPLLAKEYSISLGIKPNPDEKYWYDRCFNVANFKIEKPKNQKLVGGVIYWVPNNIDLYEV